ncbi:copper resistance protein CopC [Cryobacterium sp. CG_9.6]|uniref:copper resistance CopC family protein n=1 Tax=Cryobacterium sp. CG_9.6 TaxID=2760710 RepID=UPI00247658C6|nr:copper resistance protein CopC [Cryobacterium sp. CG_9.6]MDH6238293.1 methionine-rich copper-binding protein CopC [Cryobacterium sp. CG_9.6]
MKHSPSTSAPSTSALCTSTRRSRLPLLARVMLGGGLVVAAVGLFAAPASAHNSPIGSVPVDNSVVTEQPGVFSVTTSDLLLDLDGAGAASAMQISGPTDSPTPLFYGDGCATVSDATLESSAQLGEAGDYTVIWQTVSIDGHAISGEFAFTWQPAAGQELSTGSPDAPTCGGTAAEVTTQTTDAAADESDASATAPGAGADVLWIGAALGVVALAVGATLFFVRRRPQPAAQSEHEQK